MVTCSDIENNAELKEGSTVSMNCRDIEAICKTKGTQGIQTVRQRGESYTQLLMKLYLYVKEFRIVNITYVRKEEFGIYSCRCRCINPVYDKSQFYYGIIIVRKCFCFKTITGLST